MYKKLLTVCAISTALSSQYVTAAPAAPSIDWTPQRLYVRIETMIST